MANRSILTMPLKVSNVLHREKSDALILDTHAIGPLKPRAFHGRMELFNLVILSFIHQSAMEAFLALIRYNELKIKM